MTLTLKYISLHSYQQCYRTPFCPSYGKTVFYFKQTSHVLLSRYVKNKQTKTMQQMQLYSFDQKSPEKTHRCADNSNEWVNLLWLLLWLHALFNVVWHAGGRAWESVRLLTRSPDWAAPRQPWRKKTSEGGRWRRGTAPSWPAAPRDTRAFLRLKLNKDMRGLGGF